MPLIIRRRHNRNAQPKPRQPNRRIPPTAILRQQIHRILDRLLHHRARDAQPQRNAIIAHGQDQGRRYPLVLFGDGVAEDYCCRRERHVHAEGDEEVCDEGLGPVGLVDGHGGAEDGRDDEGEEGKDHYVGDGDVCDQQARRHGRDERGECGRGVLSGDEQRGVVAQFLQEFPQVVEPDAEAGPADGRSGEDEDDGRGEGFDGEERVGDALFGDDEGHEEGDAED